MKEGVTAHNIKATWSKWGIHSSNKTGVMTDPHYTIPLPTHPESSSLYRTETSLSEIEKLSTTLPTTVEEGQAQIKTLGSVAICTTRRLQAELAIAREELHQVPTHEKLAAKSRKVLSSARYITQADLQTARRAGTTDAQTSR